MSDLLFPEPATSRLSPLGYVEPSVHGFTELSQPRAIQSRQTVNDWYARFPDPSGTFARRLRSEEDTEHGQALDELFVYQALARRFDDVRYEEGGVGPDFRVYQDGDCVAAVEVLSLFQKQEWTDQQRAHGRLADALNTRVLPTAGYFVDFEVERADKQPSLGGFARFVTQQLDTLPPHEQWAAANLDFQDLPTACYEAEGVRIKVRFMPMRPESPTKSNPVGPIVGIGPVTVGWVNSGRRLKDRVESKAGSRYDLPEVPFLVVAGIHDAVCEDDQIRDGLYGSAAVVVATSEVINKNDGLFGIDRSRRVGRHRRVSAVAAIHGLPVFDGARGDLAIYENPYATKPWPRNYLDATRTFGVVAADQNSMQLGWL